jgi:hypothetical protein
MIDETVPLSTSLGLDDSGRDEGQEGAQAGSRDHRGDEAISLLDETETAGEA